MKNVERLKNKFKENTDGLVTQGVASLELDTGTYELHLKPYHISEYDSFNIFTVDELSRIKYEMYAIQRIESMLKVDEFPLNFVSIYKNDTNKIMLSETHLFMDNLMSESDLNYFVDDDLDTIDKIESGEVSIYG